MKLIQMYNTVWNMEDLDIDYPRTDINCGTDLMFYIEMDPPGNAAALLLKTSIFRLLEEQYF